MMRRPSSRGRRGFTLVEVVVAISVLALIGLMTFLTLSNALNTRDLLEEEDAANQAARIAMSRIRRDLQLAYLTTNTAAVNTYRTIFVGQDERGADRLWLATLSHQRRIVGAREGDQTEITYWTEDDPTRSDALVLLRREAPRIDQEPEKDGTLAPVAYGVRAFDLQYLDQQDGEWKKEWDTTGADTPNRLPRAVRVTLTLLVPDPDDAARTTERSYVSTVLLAFAPPLKRQSLSSGGT
jgi:general secretion pathway protein J